MSTERTMWLCGKEWRASPVYVSQTLLDIKPFVSQRFVYWEDKGTDAVKSALPVTALEVSGESFELHTAPLWPGMWCKTERGWEVCVARTHKGTDPVAHPIS